MLKPSTKNARRRNHARRAQRKEKAACPTESPHNAAIRRLRIELQAEEGLFCCFHGGVDWRFAQSILPRGSKVIVEIERSMVADGRRYVPDLKVSCARTRRPLLLIEVWHTHAVNARKRDAYNAHGLPWVEVKSWHVLHRPRRRPLPILDWGGCGMPDAPSQGSLFEPADPFAPAVTWTSRHNRARRARNPLRLPQAGLPLPLGPSPDDPGVNNPPARH
jgi:hypothetical protein